MTLLDKAQLHKRDNTKPKLGYTICPKHGCEGTLQIKLYVEHWLPQQKRPALCYLTLEDLLDGFKDASPPMVLGKVKVR